MTNTLSNAADASSVANQLTQYRNRLTAIRNMLETIYAGFDSKRPELLANREAEIVGLANEAERLREFLERREAEEAKKANILAVWEMVKALEGDAK